MPYKLQNMRNTATIVNPQLQQFKAEGGFTNEEAVADPEGVQGIRSNHHPRLQFLNIPLKWNNLVSLRPN